MFVSTLCYIKKDNQTLMLYRNKKKKDNNKGKWIGLGGRIELGESPEECIKREVLEESGLKIINPQMRGILTFADDKKEENTIVFLFTATNFTGELINCNEGELKWIDDLEIKNLELWEGDKLFLGWLKDGRFFSAKFVYNNGILIDHNVNFYKGELTYENSMYR